MRNKKFLIVDPAGYLFLDRAVHGLHLMSGRAHTVLSRAGCTRGALFSQHRLIVCSTAGGVE